MEEKMRNILIILLIVLFSHLLYGQNQKDSPDETSIKKTVLDYAEGYYSGDVSRMESAIHPELNKVTLTKMSRSNRNSLSYTTYTQLIEYTRDTLGKLEPEKRNIEVKILDINENIALAKVTTAKFNDYLQLIKIDKDWKIINIIWNSPNSIKDFTPENEKNAITKAATFYIEGLFSADPGKLQIAISTDFNQLTYTKSPKTGRVIFNRLKYETITGNVLNANGKIEEYRRHYDIKIYDIMDGMAFARASSFRGNEYLQLAKINNDWKVINALSKPAKINTIQEALPVMVNEPLPEFTLPIYGGGEFSTNKYKGKNLLLIFPRGLNGVNSWCPYCQYQYLDLMDIDKKMNLRKKYNLEIAFILPYKKEMIENWFKRFNETTEYLEEVKSNKAPVNQYYKETIEFVRKHYPKKFSLKEGEMKPVFPVLIDEERKVSIRFRLFIRFWNSVSIEQNIPAVYLVDKSGVVQFKYVSQMTYDRLDSEKLLEEIYNLNK
jgi:hypothetical protein